MDALLQTLKCSIAKNGYKYPLTLGHLYNIIRMNKERASNEVEQDPLKFDLSIQRFCIDYGKNLSEGTEYKCIPVKKKITINKAGKPQTVWINTTLELSTAYKVKNDKGKLKIYEKSIFGI